MSSTAYGSFHTLPLSTADEKTKTDWVDPELPELPKEQNGPWGILGQVLCTMMGSGILGFPAVMAQVGLVWTLIILTFFCVLTGASCLMMVESGTKLGVMDYSFLVENALGRRMRYCNDLAVFCMMMGALMSYMNVIGSLGMRVGLALQPHGFAFINTYPGFMITFAVCFALPICMKRAYGDLKYVCACSLLCLLSAVVFVSIRGPAESGGLHPIRMWPTSYFQLIKLLGSFAYATSCQAVVCEAHLSLDPESKHMFKYSMWGAAAIGGLLLITMSIAGNLSFGDTVSNNVMMSFSDTPTNAIGYALVTTQLVLYIPSDFVIMRFFSFKLMLMNILQVPTYQYILVTVTLFAIPVSSMASIPLPDVSGAFQLVLDLTGDLKGFQCLILPGLVYLKTFSEDGKLWMSVLAVCCVITGGICLFLGPIVDIASFVIACRSTLGCSSY